MPTWVCRYIQTVVAILTNIVKYLEEEYWGEFNILLKYLKGKGGGETHSNHLVTGCDKIVDGSTVYNT